MYSGGDPPCRLDYIWVSGTPDKARLAMQQAQHGCSYSDHLGVEAICTFQNEHTDRCLSRLALMAFDQQQITMFPDFLFLSFYLMPASECQSSSQECSSL